MGLIERLNAIGDAIREMNGTEELIPLADMPQAILDISGGAGIEPLDHTVTFMADDAPYEVVSVKDGNTVNAPTKPTKSDMAFIRWENNENEITFPFTPTEDMEIVAHFAIHSNTDALYELFGVDREVYKYVVLGCYQSTDDEAYCEVFFCKKFNDANGRVYSPTGNKVFYTSGFSVTADANDQYDIVGAIIELSPKISSSTPSSQPKYMNANHTIYYTNYKDNDFSFVPEYLS